MNINLSEDESAKLASLASKWKCAEEDAMLRLVITGLRSYDITPRKPRPNFYLFGAPGPWRKLRASNFIDDLRSRFSSKIPNRLEEAFKYIDVVTDRIITKGVGLLQFNAVLSVLLIWAFEHYIRNGIEHRVIFTSIIFSGFSSLLMIALMYTVWRKTGYEDTDYDLAWSAKLCMLRSMCMTVGLILSFLATIGAFFTYGYHEYYLAPEETESRRDGAGETLSAIQKNLETVEARLSKGEATLSVIPATLEEINDHLLNMRLAQPVNLSYLTGANCRRVQQAFLDLACYQGQVDGKCDGATNAAAGKWQMQARRTIAPAYSPEEIERTLLTAPRECKSQP